MRAALLLVIVGCAGQPQATSAPAPIEEERVELAPPVATFRWALAPVACDEGGLRSSIDTCRARDELRDEHLVAVYAPVADDDPRVAVVRYEGDHVGGPLRWQRTIDLGVAPHSAVLTIVREAVIVAAISHGTARVVAIDNIRGRLLGGATIAERGARSVQLEGIDEFARIHVRTQTGGVVAVMHPRTARVIASREIDARALVDHDLPPADSEPGDITIGWEQRRLVARRGDTWMRYLRAVTSEQEQMMHRASVQHAGERALVTIHDTETGKIEIIAYDHARGTQLWRSTLTASARQLAGSALREAIDGDQLVVQGRGPLESFTCSIGIADGVERACVDRQSVETDTVFDFTDDAVITP